MERRLCHASLLAPGFSFISEKTIAEKSALRAQRARFHEARAPGNHDFFDERRLAEEERARAAEAQRRNRTVLAGNIGKKFQWIVPEVLEVSK
jgi:hypothetical protein